MRLGPRTSETSEHAQAAPFDPPTQRSHLVTREVPTTGTWVSRSELTLEAVPSITEPSVQSASFPTFCTAKDCADSCTELIHLRSENRELRIVREKLKTSLLDQVSHALDAEKRRIQLQAATDRKTAQWEKAEVDRNTREREYREAALQHIARLEHRSREYRRELEKLRLSIGILENQSEAFLAESQAQIAVLQSKLDQQKIQQEARSLHVRGFHLPNRSLRRKPKYGLRRQELIAERNHQSPDDSQDKHPAVDKRKEFLLVLVARQEALTELTAASPPPELILSTSIAPEDEPLRDCGDRTSDEPPVHLIGLVAEQEKQLQLLRIRLQERELELSLLRGEPRHGPQKSRPILPSDVNEDETQITQSWVEPDTGLTRPLPTFATQHKTTEKLASPDFDEPYEDPIPVVSLSPTGGLVVEVELTLTTESNFYAGLSLDITLGGIFVATYHLHPLGTTADVKVSFTDGTSFLAKGEIKWTRVPSDESSPGIGIRLRNLDIEALQAVSIYRSKRLPMYFDVEES